MAFDRGTPGRSAEVEHRRRLARDEARRRERLGRLAWLGGLLAGERQSTRAWSTGAHGERRTAAELERALGARGVVLHDRRLPGSAGNIDHIAVAPSGVWVVDSKELRGQVVRRNAGGWLGAGARLYVGGRDRGAALAGVRRQGDAVGRALRHELGDRAPPLHLAVSLVGAEWSWSATPFRIGGVWISWPRGLGAMLLRPTTLDAQMIEQVSAALARRLPVR